MVGFCTGNCFAHRRVSVVSYFFGKLASSLVSGTTLLKRRRRRKRRRREVPVSNGLDIDTNLASFQSFSAPLVRYTLKNNQNGPKLGKKGKN